MTDSQPTKKRRMLVWADSPTVATGFAQVSRNILKELYDSGKWEIDMIGINYSGVYDREEFQKKYYYINKIVPALHPQSNDVFGREYALQILSGAHREIAPPWDVFFTIQDHFNVESKSVGNSLSFADSILAMQRNTLMSKNRDKVFSWVGYYPVDGMLKKHWVENAIAKTGFPVAYCEYGKEEILKFATPENTLAERLQVIRHGTNTDDFFPLSPEERRKVRKKHFKDLINDDTYLIVNINRNQMRKDLMRTLLVYKEFKKKVPNSFLYLHCNPRDVGGNIYDIAQFVGLKDTDFAVPVGFDEHTGIPIRVVNEIYNSADAIITTTLGEGWGLSITEAMATKTLVYAPNITSIPEMLNTQGGFDPLTARGIAFDSGKRVGDWVCHGPRDNEVIRPIADVDDAVEKMVWGYNHPEEVKAIIERGYEYAKELTWKSECKKWIELFDLAAETNDRLREKGLVKTEEQSTTGKLQRNDPCPVCASAGRNIKIKKCEQHREYYL